MNILADFDKDVAEFFKEFGFQATYIQQTEGAYDASIGEVGTTVVETPIEAILLDMTLQGNGLSTKFGTVIEAGDKELYVRPPNKTNPANQPLVISPTHDRVRIDSVEYKVVNMKEINTSGSNAIVYYLHIRK